MGVVRDKLDYLSGTKRLLREAINAVLADRGDPLLTESDPFESYPSALYAGSPPPSADSLTGSAADKLLRLNETKSRLREAINAELGIGLTESDPFRFYGESIWTPRALFLQGEQGALYLPEPENLFQDAAGTTPVTADGDPVGLMLDKSGNGNHVSQSVAASRPIYRTDGTLHWLEFDGVDDYLQVPNSESSFIWLHDGSGGGSAVAVEFLSDDEFQPVLQQTSSATADTGFQATRLDRAAQSEDNGYRISAYSGSTTGVTQINANVSDLIGLTPHVMRHDLISQGTSDDFQYWQNGMLKNSQQALNLSSSAASYPLTLMATGNNTFLTHGKLYGAVLRQGGMRAEIGAAVDSYLATKAGITL